VVSVAAVFCVVVLLALMLRQGVYLGRPTTFPSLKIDTLLEEEVSSAC
jgi:hypothetical protein